VIIKVIKNTNNKNQKTNKYQIRIKKFNLLNIKSMLILKGCDF
jgi:hypothetical protein